MLHRSVQVVTGVLLGLAVVALLLATGVIGPATTPAPGTAGPPAPPYPAPPLRLTSTAGRPFDLEALRGEVSLVFFGFANCPDVCPATLLHWTHALDRMGPDAAGVQGIFVSVDPYRDTPEALQRWMDGFHPSIRALTGTPEEIERVAAAWGVEVQVAHDPEGATLVNHSARSFLVDRSGEVVQILPPHLDGASLAGILLPLVSP